MKLSNEECSLIITEDGECKQIPFKMYCDIKREISEYRLDQARIIQLPAYCVFTNKTLERIALIMPRKVNELWLVDGMDAILIDTYGQEICNIVCKILKKYEVLDILYGYNVFNLSNHKVRAILGYENILDSFLNRTNNNI